MRQVPGAPCVAILFSLRRAAAEGLAGRVVRPMPAAPFGEGEDMNLADVALEALYVLGVLMCCAVLADLFLARALLRGDGGNPGPDYR